MRRAQHSYFKPLALARALFRQILHIARHKIALMLARKTAPLQACYFHPGFPHPYSVVYRMFHILGVPMKRGIPDHDKNQLGFLWKDDTFVEPHSCEYLINGACTDISKQYVEVVHKKIFGYSLEVDPLTYAGTMVCKSNLNGAHDGVEFTGPIKILSPDSVYQLVVDSRGPDEHVMPGNVCDMRVVILDGVPVFSYLKFRPKKIRFSNLNSSIKIVTIESIFEQREVAQVFAFCKEFGLDYGEIDIVRDFSSNRIYILDVNKTPLGPPNGLSQEDHAIALQLYRKEFMTWIENRKATKGCC
ncbi:hypothetical protein ACVBEF_13365 [Glaciimonas sp. GG7]